MPRSELIRKVTEDGQPEPLTFDALHDAHDVDDEERNTDRDHDKRQDATKNSSGHHGQEEVDEHESDLKAEQHKTMLGVPADLLILLLHEKRDQGKDSKVGEHDHDRAIL